ncbi:hypothetical protein Dvina_30485 [Dactylosporangium vinaceum]|uniref:Uncharacterized protein n=1 Tax=Dactylosporangium vinaceum TaxID=53362 RepID=A0ABV5MJS7_9ACTN|nr:hypothetical protein [Dactylosporangium vinaceum]UAB92656.1 hypothetical protein Dvina_30485 [Dactylosporangium vinaceum]
MRFTLTYDGPLKPDGDARHKMDIRRQLHRQLAELWTHEPLRNMGNAAEHYELVGGRGFTSVVHDAFKLRAELDVLLLREAAPGGILSRADIDNQLKTLFDALSCPHLQQVPTDWQPDSAEQPLHCLLQDDRYITRVNLETERWLDAPRPQYVRLFIRVRVTTAYPTFGSVALGI